MSFVYERHRGQLGPTRTGFRESGRGSESAFNGTLAGVVGQQPLEESGGCMCDLLGRGVKGGPVKPSCTQGGAGASADCAPRPSTDCTPLSKPGDHHGYTGFDFPEQIESASNTAQ